MSTTTRFLLDDKSIREAMSRAAKNAVSVRILTAWATSGKGLACLETCAAKDKQAIVGTCFAVTEPNALHDLIRQGFNLRVIHQLPSGGTFHPKVYLFEHPGGVWTALVGSANLTDSAFTRNTEAMVESVLTSETAAPIKDFFDTHWQSDHAKQITDEWFRSYKAQYDAAANRRSRDIADAERGTQSTSKAVAELPSTSQLQGLMKSDWAAYLSRLRSTIHHGTTTLDGQSNSYVRTLDIVTPILRDGLADGEHQNLRRVLGKTDNCGWLGTVSLMKGNGSNFYKARSLRAKVDGILAPLWNIDDGDESIAGAEKSYIALSNIDGFGSGFITRMLALTRPDRFCSVNSRSEAELSKLMGISKHKLKTWEGYERGLRIVYRTPWYRSPSPNDARSRRLWEIRVALLDAYAYAPKAE